MGHGLGDSGVSRWQVRVSLRSVAYCIWELTAIIGTRLFGGGIIGRGRSCLACWPQVAGFVFSWLRRRGKRPDRTDRAALTAGEDGCLARCPGLAPVDLARSGNGTAAPAMQPAAVAQPFIGLASGYSAW